MKPRYRLSRDAIELIKAYEGFRPRSARLGDGRWTIGYGHTKTAREGAQISAADAEALLLYDVLGAAHAVNEQVFTPLTQNQFDALVAFAFSIGLENFATSAVLRRVNEGQMLQAAYAMELWRKATVGGEAIVVDALVRRRAAEKALFLTPHNGVAPAPSPVLPPQLDYTLIMAAPAHEPAAVVAPLDGEDARAELVDGSPELGEPPSATEAASAALGSRLERLLTDMPEPQAEPQFAPQPEPQPSYQAEQEQAFRPDPGLEGDTLFPSREPEAQAAPPPEAVPPVEVPPAAEAEPEPALEPAEPQAWADRPLPEAIPAPRDLVIYDDSSSRFQLQRQDLVAIGMLLGGIALFGAGIIWGLNLATERGGGLGWLVGLGGVGLVCVGFYRLLKKLGDGAD